MKAPVVSYLHQRQLGGRSGATCHSHLQALAEHKLVESHEFDSKPSQVPSTTKTTFLVAFSLDGTKMASTHGDHNVYISHLQSGVCLSKLEGHPRTPWCIAFHPSSNEILASGCLGGVVKVWDLHGGSETYESPYGTAITSLAFHPTDHVLVFATFNELFFWDWSEPSPFASCKTANEREKLRFVKFDPLGHYIFTAISNPMMHDAPILPTDRPNSLDNRQADLLEQYRAVVNRYREFQRDYGNARMSLRTSTAPASSGNVEVQDLTLSPSRSSTSHEQRAGSSGMDDSIIQGLTSHLQRRHNDRRQQLRERRSNRHLWQGTEHFSDATSVPELELPVNLSDSSSAGTSELENLLRSSDEATPQDRRRLRLSEMLRHHFENLQENVDSYVMDENLEDNSAHAEDGEQTLANMWLSRLTEETRSSGPRRSTGSILPWPNSSARVNPYASSHLSAVANSSAASSSRRCIGPSHTGGATWWTSSSLASALAQRIAATDAQREEEEENHENSRPVENSNHDPLLTSLRLMRSTHANPTANISFPDNETSNTQVLVSWRSLRGPIEDSDDSLDNEGARFVHRLQDLISAVIQVWSVRETLSHLDQQANSPSSRGSLEQTTSHDTREPNSTCAMCGGRVPDLAVASEDSNSNVSSSNSNVNQLCESVASFYNTSHDNNQRSNISQASSEITVPDATYETVGLPVVVSNSDSIESFSSGSDTSVTSDSTSVTTVSESGEMGERREGLQIAERPVAVMETVSSSQSRQHASDSLSCPENLVQALARLQRNLHLIDSDLLNHSGVPRFAERLSEVTLRVENLYINFFRSVPHVDDLPQQVIDAIQTRHRQLQVRLDEMSLAITADGNATTTAQQIQLLSLVAEIRYQVEASLEGMRSPEREGHRMLDGQVLDVPRYFSRHRNLLRYSHRQSGLSYFSRLPFRTHPRRPTLTGHRQYILERVRSSRNVLERVRANAVPNVQESSESVAGSERSYLQAGNRLLSDEGSAFSTRAPTWRQLLPEPIESLNEPAISAAEAMRRAIMNRGNPAGSNREPGTAAGMTGGQLVSMTHRIQQWDFRKYQIPDISDANANILVPQCKIHNDANCDISLDGKLLACFIHIPRIPFDTVLAIFSLEPELHGQCLYTHSFGSTAVSVSISPCNQYVLVGKAIRRFTYSPHHSENKAVMGQIFKLNKMFAEADEESMKKICDVFHPLEVPTQHVSANSARWLPNSGEGLVYCTNKGHVTVCRPWYSGDEGKESKSLSASQAQPASGLEAAVRPGDAARDRVLAVLRRAWARRRHSAGTQTFVSRDVQTASTQTD